MSGKWRVNGRCTEWQRWTIRLRLVDAKATANDAFAYGRVPGDPGKWPSGLRYSWGDNARCYYTTVEQGAYDDEKNNNGGAIAGAHWRERND